MTPVLRDVGLDRRQLGDLMAPWIADAVSRAQRVRTLPTGIGHEVDDRIDALEGHERAMVARMARLSADLAPTLHASAAHPWASCEPIGGRRFRSSGGILLAEGELAFKIGDPLRLLRELVSESLILLLQSFNLSRLTITRVARMFPAWRFLLAPPWHQSERTKSMPRVQAPPELLRKRSDGLLGESGHERRRLRQAPPVPHATAPLLDSTSNQTMVDLDAVGLRSYVAEPDRGRRDWSKEPEAQAPVYANRRRTRGSRGRRLMRQRGAD